MFAHAGAQPSDVALVSRLRGNDDEVRAGCSEGIRSGDGFSTQNPSNSQASVEWPHWVAQPEWLCREAPRCIIMCVQSELDRRFSLVR